MMERRFRPALGATLGILIGVLIVALVVLIVGNYTVTSQIRESQVSNTKARKSSDATLDAVRSCTTPGRDCYDRGQAQTAKAVGDINRVVILASACSVGLDPKISVNQRQAQISQCVIQRLAEQAGK